MTDKPSPSATLDVKAAYFDEHPRELTPEYMTNFPMHLPGGGTRLMVQEHMPDDFERVGFYKAIDIALERCGISLEQVERLNLKSNAAPLERQRRIRMALHRATLPAHIYLLERGFKFYDLNV